MADTTTTNLNLTKPEIGGAEDTWGVSINSNLDTIDALFGASGSTVNFGSVQVAGTNGVNIQQGAIKIKNGGTQSYIDFYCESNNAHYLRLQAPAHAAFSGNPTVTLPASAGNLVGTGDSGTVTNTMLAGSIANAKLANSSATLNSQTLTLGGSLTLDTDNIGEGSSNLYFTNERVDDRVNALLVAGSNITLTYDDAGNTLTIAASGGGSGTVTEAFKTISVSGQDNIVADSATDTLTIAAGSGITLTTNASTDTLTITNSGSASNSFETIAVSGQSNVVADSGTDTLTLVAGSNMTITTDASTDTITFASTGGGSSTPSIDDNGNATAITIDSSERVMIGTTDPGYPDYGDSLTLGDVDGGGGNSGMTIRSGTSSYGTFYFSDATGTAAGTYAGKMQYNHSNNSMVFGTNSADRLTIDSSGNVGLNGLSAGDYWSTSNQLVLGNTTSSANGGMTIATADNAVGQIYFADGTSGDARYRGQIQYTHVSDAMDFATAASFRMRIDSSGNLLVGTTTTGGTASAKIEANGGTNGRCIQTKVTGTGSANAITFNNGNGQVGYIATSGTSTSYVTFSDYRLKENVNYNFNALDRVAQLKPARFNFIADANTTIDGFLAHEVSEIVPEAIFGKKDGKEMQGIDQSKLVPLLTKAIQEQQEQIEALQSEINTLKGGE